MTQENPEKNIIADTASEEEDEYMPVFSKQVRTVIYVLGVLLGAAAIVLGVLASDLGWPKWAADTIAIVGPLLPSISAAFGVKYAGVSK